jgi:hypothetical protein
MGYSVTGFGCILRNNTGDEYISQRPIGVVEYKKCKKKLKDTNSRLQEFNTLINHSNHHPQQYTFYNNNRSKHNFSFYQKSLCEALFSTFSMDSTPNMLQIWASNSTE